MIRATVPALPLVLAALGCACGADEADARAQAREERAAAHTEVQSSPALDIPAEEGPRALVKLVILGEFPDDLAAAVDRGLRDELDVEVERIEGVALPRRAYYPPRRRYRADRLLEHLNARLSGDPPTTRVLGLTSVDISTTKPPHRDWGVFGLGELGGRSCVVSTFRLRRRARDDDHVRFRVVTTAIHEVGHTLGLPHCTEPRCVMRDAEGSIETVDTSTGHLGPACRTALTRSLGTGRMLTP